MLLQSVILVAATFSKQVFASHGKIYKYVAAFSIDGLHSSDVEKYVALRPESTIASLLSTGYEYTDAYTSGPSDSFPGTMNLFTGSSPRTTRVWYDDTYDRSFWPPFSTTGSNCSGPPGAEGLFSASHPLDQLTQVVVYDESKDYDSTMLFSGGINPLNLPQTLVSEKCVNLYPHSRLRVNTAFEVVHAAGHQTAYTDKHPAYDIVRGPSGAGLSVGYFPEIAAVDADVDSTIAYDKLHVKAFLDWINAKTPVNSTIYEPLKTIPTLFGGNFQAVSVGQKVYGYVKGTLAFTPQLLKAYDFVDASLGQVVAALKAKSILEDTLIIVASKHGQAPIDPTLYGKVDPALLNLIIKVPVESITTDDIALIFLQNHADTDAAVDNLNRNRNTLKIADIISGDRLTYLGYGDPKTDPAVPDIIVRPDTGIIYTTSKSKIAEHGGLSDDDRKVACFVSNPGLKKTVYDHRVSTAQVAPTILEALGLDAQALQGVVAEKTRLLDGF